MPVTGGRCAGESLPIDLGYGGQEVATSHGVRHYFDRSLPLGARRPLMDAQHRGAMAGQALGDALSVARIKALAQFKQDYHA